MGYVSVVLDIPARSLSETFTYAVPAHLAPSVEVGCTVLVRLGSRMCGGYVVALSDSCELLDPARVRPLEQVLAEPAFGEVAARAAAWMARTYVAPLSECVRLFLPPGARAKVVRDADGAWRVEAPQAHAAVKRWVSLTEKGFVYEPPARATRQRLLMDALAYGPVTTSELALLYTDMSSVVRTLERKGVVAVEERRDWRGADEQTTLSSARAAVPVELTAGQRAALDAIESARHAGAGDVVLVDGVTGSGKTEVYLSAIERTLAEGRSACVLVPEISLTAQTVGRFRTRFGDAVAVFHSRLSAGERLDQWDMVRSGAARVVVGARSALFCPFSDLGLIVIDEEHEQSYKQGSSPRYHARETAAELARLWGAALVLGSATPSLEALERCRAGSFAGARWTRVEMPERPGGAVLPRVTVADLTREFRGGSRSIFSKPLAEGLARVVDRREKAVLLHNRRGFAPFLMCRECGCVPTCNHCSTALTYHERTHTLECHTCGSVWHVRPYPDPSSKCPKCGSRYLAKMGLGTQQVEDALRDLLPEHVAVIRMDADSTRGKDAHKRLLEEFDAADTAVLLGTQMIAKGLDFPEVTLVGVVNADYALKMPDFRSAERCYDLLEQVAGRAGRGQRPGEVVIQTYLPDHPVIRAVASHDRSILLDAELPVRREVGYPPYVRLSNVLAWGADEAATRAYIDRLAALLREAAREAGEQPVAPAEKPAPSALACAPHPSDPAASVPLSPAAPAVGGEVQILGPVSCAIARAKDRYRFHVLVKSPYAFDVSGLIGTCLGKLGSKPGISVAVDVDAYDLM